MTKLKDIISILEKNYNKTDKENIYIKIIFNQLFKIIQYIYQFLHF